MMASRACLRPLVLFREGVCPENGREMRILEVFTLLLRYGGTLLMSLCVPLYVTQAAQGRDSQGAAVGVHECDPRGCTEGR
jgi:hypothetical protein